MGNSVQVEVCIYLRSFHYSACYEECLEGLPAMGKYVKGRFMSPEEPSCRIEIQCMLKLIKNTKQNAWHLILTSS